MAEILVPLDGSGRAEQVLPCAMMLARGLPATIVLYRAVSVSPDTLTVLDSTGIQTTTLINQMEREANDYLARTAAALTAQGFTTQTVTHIGPPADCIVDYATQINAQMIVMATHGYTGINRWTRGSVAERVLQQAHAPVLMLRADDGLIGGAHDAMACRTILAPLDGSALAEKVLPVATAIACAVGAELILFHVPIVMTVGSLSSDEWFLPEHGAFDTAERDAQIYLDKVADKLSAAGVKVSTAMQMGGVAESIIDYAEANRVNLIAMSTHGRSGLGRWRMGSVADRVLRGSGLPVLLVRAH